jgi:hypothetical protein
MQPSDDSVDEFLEGIDHPLRRRDAATMVDLMGRITGEEPRRWGSIVGFGHYDYRYESGREGTAPAAGFSPRASATTIYLADGVASYEDLLGDLGPHTTGTGCLYIKDLETVDHDVLSTIVAQSYASLTAGIYTRRAREGGGGAS